MLIQRLDCSAQMRLQIAVGVLLRASTHAELCCKMCLELFLIPQVLFTVILMVKCIKIVAKSAVSQIIFSFKDRGDFLTVRPRKLN